MKEKEKKKEKKKRNSNMLYLPYTVNCPHPLLAPMC